MSEKTKLSTCDWAAMSLAAFFVSAILIPPFLRNIAQAVCPEAKGHVCEQVGQWVSKPSITDWFLVAVGVGQLFVFRMQMVISRRQTDILHRQTETLPLIERAYLRVKIAENGIRIGLNGLHGDVQIDRGTFRLSVENNGKTPAEITRIAWGVGLVAHAKDQTADSIIEAIDPTEVGGRAIPPGIESAPGDPYLGESENLVPRFWGIEHDQIAKDTHALWVRGFVRYRDVFGGNHIVGFCYVFDGAHDVFVSRGDARYNYKRSEDENEIPPAALWPPS